MQRGELIIEPTLKAMIYYYRTSCMSKKQKGSYQGSAVINAILSNLYIPVGFLFFYNIYYGISVLLIGLFFVILQNLHVRFSSNKVRYIISKNKVRIIDGLNNRTASMVFDEKLKLKTFPSLRGDLHNLRSVVLETDNDKFYLIGIPFKSVQKMIDFISDKEIKNEEVDFINNKNLNPKTKNIDTKTYLLIVLFINITLIFVAYNISKSIKTELFQSMILILIISEIIIYFILRLFYKNN